MTRFARAKGSKACNEKAPEDGTPWEVMKEQLLQSKRESDESKKRKEAEQQRKENYENFLKDRKVQKRKATWCEFPEAGHTSNNINETSLARKKQKLTKASDSITFNYVTTNGNTKKETAEGKNKKKKVKKLITSQNETSNESSDPLQVPESQSQKKKNKKKKQKSESISNNPLKEEGKFNMNDSQIPNKHEENQVNIKQNKKVKAPKKKSKKLINGKPLRRKEINDRSFQLIINGKDVDLVRFDGFPIMRKDAERLEELRKSMIEKGIPKSEVQRTIKLERRRSEKALARLKKDVCYNCRKGGHNLSDCPELKSKIPGVDGAQGVCFKCGSTEHRQFECKVQKDKEFRFATCFICKESGHIARQCPDNPRGLYPNGGCCKLCGDVTHLRKDCPTASNKKEESTVKLHTLDTSDNLEEIEYQTKMSVQGALKLPKKIKF